MTGVEVIEVEEIWDSGDYEPVMEKIEVTEVWDHENSDAYPEGPMETLMALANEEEKKLEPGKFCSIEPDSPLDHNLEDSSSRMSE